MRRLRHVEWMDDPALSRAEHEYALASLNRINGMLGANRKLYGYLSKVGEPQRMSVLDLGAGGGGFLGYIARRRQRDAAGTGDQNNSRGGREARPPLLAGLDISHFAVSRAKLWQGPAVQGVVGDAQRLPLADASVDAVTCQLMLHHFDEPQVVTILREAARVARRGVVVVDLSRSWLAWGLTWLTTRLVSRSRVFHHDGPRSVRAAWRKRQFAELAQQAGLAGARVQRAFPFRLVLVWRRQPAGNQHR